MISNGDVRLIDFGMSTFYVDGDGNHLNGDPNKTEIIGSPNFCSPVDVLPLPPHGLPRQSPALLALSSFVNGAGAF